MAGGVLIAFRFAAAAAKGVSPARDIAELMQGFSVITIADDGFLFLEPDNKPAKPILCFYDTGGFDPVISKDSKDFQPTVQIIAVGEPQDPEPAYELLNNVKAVIQDKVNLNTFFTANDLTYYGIYTQGDINYLGTDENGIARYSLNLRIYRSENQ